MSMIRAIINCERCYELADPINGTANDKAKLLNNDKIYAARNEALKALEDHMETLDKIFPNGYLIVYTCPDEQMRMSLYNPHKYKTTNNILIFMSSFILCI